MGGATADRWLHLFQINFLAMALEFSLEEEMALWSVLKDVLDNVDNKNACDHDEDGSIFLHIDGGRPIILSEEKVGHLRTIYAQL